jgi:hypothetical protein
MIGVLSMRNKTKIFAGLSVSVLLSACGNEAHVSSSESAGYTPGLAVQMRDMQYWTHKLGLSIDAENPTLVGFYVHELEEAVEDLIASIESYDGHAISQMARTMLLPEVEQLERIVDAGDWAAARHAFGAVIQTCNVCHEATEHGYIVITEGYANNPFNQSFLP